MNQKREDKEEGDTKEKRDDSSSNVDNFLKESSIRSRLRRLPSIQDLERAISLNESREQSNHSLINCSTNDASVRPFQPYQPDDSIHRINLCDNNVIPGSTGFRQTLKEIIMVPYVEKNKTVSKGSQMYVYLIILII